MNRLLGCDCCMAAIQAAFRALLSQAVRNCCAYTGVARPAAAHLKRPAPSCTCHTHMHVTHWSSQGASFRLWLARRVLRVSLLMPEKAAAAMLGSGRPRLQHSRQQ